LSAVNTVADADSTAATPSALAVAQTTSPTAIPPTVR
jgi:hypothetical protein